MPRPLLAALVAVLAILSVGLAACGGNDEPIAQIDKLTGVSTTVALDKGFVDALGTLNLTPGTVGKGKFNKAGTAVSFPITGGDVTYYAPASDVRPPTCRG